MWFTLRNGPWPAAACLLGALAWLASGAAQEPAGLAQMRAFAKELLVSENYPEALNTYITIAEQTPRDPRSHYDVAGTMAFLQMYAEVVPRIERAIALDPDNVLYLELAALTYIQLDRLPEAFEATRRGAQLGDIKAMYSLSGMYQHGQGTAPSQEQALLWMERSARAGHMGAMDTMSKVFREGLYGQVPDKALEQSWQRELERAMAR